MPVTDLDVLAAIEARGGSAYPASLLLGVANRCVNATHAQCLTAVRAALARGLIVQTPLGLYQRPPV